MENYGMRSTIAPGPLIKVKLDQTLSKTLFKFSHIYISQFRPKFCPDRSSVQNKILSKQIFNPDHTRTVKTTIPSGTQFSLDHNSFRTAVLFRPQICPDPNSNTILFYRSSKIDDSIFPSCKNI